MCMQTAKNYDKGEGERGKKKLSGRMAGCLQEPKPVQGAQQARSAAGKPDIRRMSGPPHGGYVQARMNFFLCFVFRALCVVCCGLRWVVCLCVCGVRVVCSLISLCSPPCPLSAQITPEVCDSPPHLARRLRTPSPLYPVSPLLLSPLPEISFLSLSPPLSPCLSGV